jgi:hypothetical protein
MKYIILAALFFFAIFELTAQSDFRKGYIIKNNNDTLWGLIDYKGNKANARICIYKKDNESEKQIFTPEEIKNYRFTDNKYYISKSVDIGTKTKQLFLEFLINGVVDIYYYRDNLGEHYLIDNGTDNLYELKNEKREIIINDIKYLKDSKEYIGMLKYYFKESPSISQKAETIDLSHKSLISITHDYHNEVCTNEECIIYEKKLPNNKKRIGILIGLNGLSFVQGKFTEGYYYMRNSQFGFNVFPSIGFFYKKNLPYLNERISFQYECTYSRVKLQTYNTYVLYPDNLTYLNDIRLTHNTLSNTGFFKYEIPKGKIRPTFQIGASVNLSYSTNYLRNEEVKYSTGEIFYTKRNYDSPFENLNLGFVCGIGLKSKYHNEKDLFLDIRYQKGLFGLLQSLKTNTYSINLGLQIGK